MTGNDRNLGSGHQHADAGFESSHVATARSSAFRKYEEALITTGKILAKTHQAMRASLMTPKGAQV
jgi:hypothetical protein